MSVLPQFFCPLPWESMTGDETERFCPRCQRSVHNLQALSIERKLELLRMPRNTLCGRYRLAIRRAVPGREPCYFEHLLKYGAGVALASAAFITLWEVSSAAERANGQRRFHVGGSGADLGAVMPPEFYAEESGLALGVLVIACPASIPPPPASFAPVPPRELEIRLDDSALQKFLRVPPPMERPPLELPSRLSPQ